MTKVLLPTAHKFRLHLDYSLATCHAGAHYEVHLAGHLAENYPEPLPRRFQILYGQPEELEGASICPEAVIMGRDILLPTVRLLFAGFAPAWAARAADTAAASDPRISDTTVLVSFRALLEAGPAPARVVGSHQMLGLPGRVLAVSRTGHGSAYSHLGHPAPHDELALELRADFERDAQGLLEAMTRELSGICGS
jgi:hypothetical protein